VLTSCAAQVLLNKTPFFLERGRCYGLIGQNGVGKTTLLTRIAAGDINNFPKDVSCYYIQHEILAEAGTGVLTFMLGQVRAFASGLLCALADISAGAGGLWPGPHHRRAQRRRLL
jgi:ABC-type hemin transport system ATPase subunit